MVSRFGRAGVDEISLGATVVIIAVHNVLYRIAIFVRALPVGLPKRSWEIHDAGNHLYRLFAD